MWFSAPRRCYQLQGEQHVVQNNLRVFGLRLCCVTCGCVIHAQRLRSVTTPRRRGCAGWFGMRRMAGWRAGCSDWPNVLDGMKPTEAAGRAGMDRQTLRDWAIRCNAEGIEGLCDRPKSGRPTWLDDGQLAAFKALVLRSPDPERDGVSTWRAKDLCRIVEDRFGVSYTENGMLRLLHPSSASGCTCASASSRTVSGSARTTSSTPAARPGTRRDRAASAPSAPSTRAAEINS